MMIKEMHVKAPLIDNFPQEKSFNSLMHIYHDNLCTFIWQNFTFANYDTMPQNVLEHKYILLQM